MKRIILMRHAHAEEGLDAYSDFERSLTHKGKSIARLMTGKLREKISDPGILITSPAFRALETALILTNVYKLQSEKIQLDSRLYSSFNSKVLLELLATLKDDEDTLTLFGHNPTFSNLAHMLCREISESMPKSGIISIVFDAVNWAGIKPGSGRFEYFLNPKSPQ